MTDTFDVAIVGGGPAGSATAIRLASLGYSVVVFERRAQPEWRACGVFAGPLVRRRLAELGLSMSAVAAVSRPISALQLQAAEGATCRLEYTHGLACGFDRVRLDAALIEQARGSGAVIRTGTVVTHVALPEARRNGRALGTLAVSRTSDAAGASQRVVAARIVVGADGASSRVARAAGVMTSRNWLHRSGITFHTATQDDGQDEIAGVVRFVIGGGWYVGIAPVPDDRVNVGIVVPSTALAHGVTAAVREVASAVPASARKSLTAARTDAVAVAGRLEHHVSRAAGPGFVLVGDAIEFIDPLTGEGLHRALVTAELAAESIDRELKGDLRATAVYDRRVRSRFRSKNVVSLVLQAFVAQPAALDYALARLNRRPSTRADLALVLADHARASRALDPRFLLQLLAP